MKRFRSRIEPLRRVREQAEQLARLQAAAAQMEKHRADERCTEIAAQIERMSQQGLIDFGDGRVEIMQSIMNTAARLEVTLTAAVAKQVDAQKSLMQSISKVAAAKTELKIADTHIEQERIQHRHRNRAEEENDRQENTARRFSRS